MNIIAPFFCVLLKVSWLKCCALFQYIYSVSNTRPNWDLIEINTVMYLETNIFLFL